MRIPSLAEIPDDYDVVVMGGALSGAATAILLLRKNPGIRILIVEKSEAFGRKVGEATVEVSAYFLGRVLGMTHFLNHTQVSKQGLRFWFANERVNSLDQASELGPRYLARLPSYQLDRAVVDEEVLKRAVDAGADLLRPASISGIRLASGGSQSLDIRQAKEKRTIAARWLVDASGMAALIARQEGWWRSNTQHPTAAAWSRWNGVKDWDGAEFAAKYPTWASSVYGIRGTATNHIIGDGWWSWWIPLKGGDISVGIVFDQRLTEFPKEGGKVGDRLKAFLMKHPVAREMIADAEYDENDVHWRRNLAYSSEVYSGDGFVLVGDAAAFMDPFYSPGMDWISFTTSGAAELITAARRGEAIEPLVARHNRDFRVSHDRWFQSLYCDKYEYMGEFDLMTLAFKFDLGLYYWGVVEPVFHGGEKGLLAPPFSPPSGRWFAFLIRSYHRRFVKIARRRRRLGLLGRTNDGKRALLSGYTLERKDTLRIFPMLRDWFVLEFKEGWKSWLDADEPAPSPASRKSPADEASLG